MTMNQDIPSTNADRQAATPDRKNDPDCNDAGEHSGNSQDAGMVHEEAVASREKSAAAREGIARLREQTADQRDDVAQVREQAVHVREDVTAGREKIIQEAEALKVTLENHITRLREANEHLVIAAVQAQRMTEAVQKVNHKMDHMAHHDFLTGLANRSLLGERITQAIALAKRHHQRLAVLFIDLDRFKIINDSLGHVVGDMLLQSAAQRMQATVRSTDTVSRYGGDEFIVLLSEVTDQKSVSDFADKIGNAISASYRLAEQELHIGATIGISMYPDDGDDAETLIQNADAAMYHAKSAGRGRHYFFKPAMNVHALQLQQTEAALRGALERQEFVLYYQPQVALQTGKIIGVEALIRWHHPAQGLLLPAAFIPIAEACGALVAIGGWALREACGQAQTWRDSGLASHVMAVNISAIEFEQDGFLEGVRAVLLDTGLDPQHLELELTETVLMENAESTIAMLKTLKSMGIHIAVDDFGTGYSSLSYLKQFPVDTLKIDQSFVAGIGSHGDNDILVDSVVNLGKSLRHRVIAEGIETREQFAFLSNHHCPEGQGYYLSPPIPAEEMGMLFKNGLSMDLFSQSVPLR